MVQPNQAENASKDYELKFKDYKLKFEPECIEE